MKYIIDGTETFDSASAAAGYITDNMGEDIYEEMLDECYGEIDVCGYSYSASYALRELDPVAYRCGMADYYDSLSGDIENDLDGADDGDELDFYGFSVECVDDEETEDEEDEDEKEAC